MSFHTAPRPGQFQERGYSAVVCGPGNIAQAHQPNEYISVEQLEARRILHSPVDHNNERVRRTMATRNRFAELHDEITGWRRDLHRHPELLFDTHRTSAFVEGKLREFGCDRVVGGIGADRGRGPDSR